MKHVGRAVLIATVTALSLAQSAFALSLEGTKIVFASNRDVDMDIFVMNVDGSNQTALTANSTADDYPAWSPDGTKIVFCSNRDGNYEIYTMDADGSNQTRLTSNTVIDYRPCWSPDGTKIAFLRSDGDDEIAVMNADGSSVSVLTANSATDWRPMWSPDSAKIVFSTNRDGNYEIYTMNADGSSPTRLTNNAYADHRPAWSPDGARIAFTSDQYTNNEIFAMDFDGSNVTRLTNDLNYDDDAAWSPDGTKIVYKKNIGGSYEIYTMNADGSGETRLMTNAYADGNPGWSTYVTPIWQLSATAVDAGTVTVSSADSTPPTFDITNDGGGTLTVSGITSSNAQFAVSPAPPYNLTSGQSQTVTVTFTPTKVGWEQSTLTIAHNASGSPATVTANGIGRVNPPTGDLANTKVAFASNQDGDYEIYAMNADGTNAVKLTNNSASDDSPVWSPDGTMIAFKSNRDGNYEIYVMNADGSNPVNLTNNTSVDSYLAWSPDGTKIAFMSYRDGSTYEIYAMNADGTNPVRLTNNSVSELYPAWSPDGTKIAFSTNQDGNWEIYAMNADGTNPVRLTNNPALDTYSAWSPDGTKIAFYSDRDGNNEIYAMNADGTNPVRLTSNAVVDRDPAWSPDGTKIAFSTNQDGNYEIYAMNADGTSPVRLTNNATTELNPSWSPFPALPSLQLSATAVDAGTVTVSSADSTPPTFDITNDGGGTLTVSGITSSNAQFAVSPAPPYNLTSGQIQTVTVTFTPTKVGWEQSTLSITHNASGSPATVTANGIGRIEPPTGDLAGTKIAFYSNRDGNNEIYVANADGTDPENRTTIAADDTNPAWSPDGTKVAFASYRDGNWEIYTMNADGTNPVRLTNHAVSDDSPAWSPDGTKIAFVSYRDGNWEIYTMNADGTNLVNVTNNAAEDTYPAWSSDGKKIAFDSNRDGNWDIYAVNADGTNPVRLTNHAADDTNPAWSPDGTKIAFASYRDGNWEIYTMNADGSAVANLTSHAADDNSATWSPDGTKIAFHAYRIGNWEVYSMDADGQNVVNLTNAASYEYYAAWSPFLPPSLATTLGVRWRLFSLPGPATNAAPVNLAGKGVTTMYEFDAAPAVQNYEAVSLASSEALPFVSKGYFIFRDAGGGSLAADFYVDVDAPEAASVSVTLEPGWNLVGAPYGGAPASAYNPTPNTVFGFDGANYLVVSALSAFEGYWVYNESDNPLTVAIEQGANETPAIVRRQPTPSWVAPLTVALDSGETRAVELGVEKSAKVGFDALDTPLPPPTPFAGYSEFYAATTDRVARLTRSVLPARQESASWTLNANLAEAGTLRWDALKLPDGYRLTLESGNERFDLSESGSMRVSSGRNSFTARLTFSAPPATRLMANFPNPFNPETWIPFELKEGSDVTVTVFDMSGNVVRRLDLGYRDAGYYTSRDEAACWDGRNELGERVVSGVYFYHLNAGSFSETRRLVVVK